jgi:hypothetical protein
VLASRLRTLVAEGVLARVPGDAGHDEYELTAKGLAVRSVLRELMAWGDEYYSPRGPRRVFLHAADDGALDHLGRCESCGETVAAADTIIAPGPGFEARGRRTDLVTTAVGRPHRLLEPVRDQVASTAGREQAPD